VASKEFGKLKQTREIDVAMKDDSFR